MRFARAIPFITSVLIGGVGLAYWGVQKGPEAHASHADAGQAVVSTIMEPKASLFEQTRNVQKAAQIIRVVGLVPRYAQPENVVGRPVATSVAATFNERARPVPAKAEPTLAASTVALQRYVMGPTTRAWAGTAAAPPAHATEPKTSTTATDKRLVAKAPVRPRLVQEATLYPVADTMEPAQLGTDRATASP